MTTKTLPTPQVDFDKIKKALKDFLSQKPEYTDHNFEGSALSTLIDLLAYNTHFIAMYNSMALNETFLDSAIKRSSVVSRAKEAGYTPRSVSAATALLNVVIPNVSLGEATTTRTISRGTKFIGKVPGVNRSFPFVVVDPVTTFLTTESSFVFANVAVKHGELRSFTYVVTEDNALSSFELPHPNVDTSTIRVRIKENATSNNIEQFFQVQNIYDVDGDSKVFYLQEGIYGQFDIFFGDGILGKRLEPGNVILIDYLMTTFGANDIRTFVVDSGVAGFIPSRAFIVSSSPSEGEAEKESIASIKRNAPLFRASQNRAVTVDDYTALLRNRFPFIESLSVWGGEDNVPPVYGKVFISIKPKDGFAITEATKQSIISEYLKRYNVVSIQPTYVDPELVYVGFDITIKYNPNNTLAQDQGISASLGPVLQSYFNENLNSFKKTLYYSDVVGLIKDLDPAFRAANISIRLQRRVPFISSRSQPVHLSLSAPIKPSSFSSPSFSTFVGAANITNAFLKDVPRTTTSINTQMIGDVSIFRRLADGSSQRLIDVGTINYSTGAVAIPTLLILSTRTDEDLYCSALVDTPADVTPAFNQVLVFDDSTRGSLVDMPSGVNIKIQKVTD